MKQSSGYESRTVESGAGQPVASHAHSVVRLPRAEPPVTCCRSASAVRQPLTVSTKAAGLRLESFALWMVLVVAVAFSRQDQDGVDGGPGLGHERV